MNAKLLAKIAALSGAKFIGINNYISATSGEIADHVINVNVSVNNAKEADLARLQSVCDLELGEIALKVNIAIETVKTAFEEMLQSAIKNLSADHTERSKQSQGQTDAYLVLTPAIKIHKETNQIHIFGQKMSKVVHTPGEYKVVKSSDKTLAKKAITKHLNLRSGKYGNFIIENIDTVSIMGEQIEAN